jgi:hypothetical protein
MDWDSYQLGAVLSNTLLGSAHDGLDFGCYNCGTLLCQDDEIGMIQRGAIWSNCKLETLTYGDTIHNKWKNCMMKDAKCAACNQSVGSLYLKSFIDAKPGQQFPTVKMTYIRENKNKQRFNQTVLLTPSYDELEKALSLLTLDSDQAGVSSSGARLNTATHDSSARSTTTKRDIKPSSSPLSALPLGLKSAAPAPAVALPVAAASVPAPTLVPVSMAYAQPYVAPLGANISTAFTYPLPVQPPQPPTEQTGSNLGKDNKTPAAKPGPAKSAAVASPVKSAAIAAPLKSAAVVSPVSSFDNTQLLDCAVFLFTGNNRLLVFQMLDGTLDLPSGSILPSDVPPLRAAERLLKSALGFLPRYLDLRRYILHETTAVYSMHTGMMFDLQHSSASVQRLHLLQVADVEADVLRLPDTAVLGRLSTRFSNLAQCRDVLDAIRRIVSKETWQCYVDPGMWQTYDRDVQEVLRQAKKAGLDECKIMRHGIPYTMKFLSLKQCRKDGKFNTKRDIRSILECNFCS